MFHQVGQGGGVREVVDSDDLDVLIVLDCAEDVPADPAESVDSDAHDVPLCVWSPANWSEDDRAFPG